MGFYAMGSHVRMFSKMVNIIDLKFLFYWAGLWYLTPHSIIFQIYHGG
jgi:hypothetical protein